MTETTREEILSWIDASLDNEDIENYTVLGLGGSEKGEGYMADILFVKAKGTKKSDGKPAELNLVLKVSKAIPVYTQSLFFYKRELYVYNQVFPTFKEFELEKKSKNPFNNIPKCFSTLDREGKQILILENLKSAGYELCDSTIPMNIQHIKTVLKIYAKLHALSFAFKDQKKRDFDRLTANYTSMYKTLANGDTKAIFTMGPVKTCNMLKEVDADLAEKINNLVIARGGGNLLNEIFDINEEEFVITHGDCWTNNFMFQYEDGNKESPTNVSIIDWQFSSLHSPMIDLAYFLFFVSSTEQVSKFDELLKYYHNNLSDFLRELGSDAEEIFSYNTMLKHWKQFSGVGLIYSLSFLELLTANKEDTVQVETYQTNDDLIQGLLKGGSKNNAFLVERLLATSRYYFKLIEE